MDAEKPKCCVIMPSKFMWSRGGQCTRKAKVERNGKHYCGVHDPVRLKTAQNERDAIYLEQSRERQRVFRLQAAAPDLLEALELYALSYTDEELVQLAESTSGLGEVSPTTAKREIIRRAAIAKSKGETK